MNDRISASLIAGMIGLSLSANTWATTLRSGVSLGNNYFAGKLGVSAPMDILNLWTVSAQVNGSKADSADPTTILSANLGADYAWSELLRPGATLSTTIDREHAITSLAASLRTEISTPVILTPSVDLALHSIRLGNATSPQIIKKRSTTTLGSAVRTFQIAPGIDAEYPLFDNRMAPNLSARTYLYSKSPSQLDYLATRSGSRLSNSSLVSNLDSVSSFAQTLPSWMASTGWRFSILETDTDITPSFSIYKSAIASSTQSTVEVSLAQSLTEDFDLNLGVDRALPLKDGDTTVHFGIDVRL